MNCGTTHYEGCPCHEARRNAEVERLLDGVEEVAEALAGPHSLKDIRAFLWALLEENHDDR